MDEQSKPKVWQVMGENFELESKFKVIDYLGAGAYGMVCAVQDSDDGNVVAIKKCKKIFQSRTLAKRTLREMRLLRQFSHENIIKLRSILQPSDLRYYTDLYLVFEIMDTDLAQIIRSPQQLKEQHTQYFIYQLLRALEYLHSKNIVHRDIKPRNILVNADCTLKVADFGLARMYNKDGPESVVAITDYVTTRWYRAPEVIVGWSRYGATIDMWAVGCILAELISRSPLFPGENTMKQLGLIIRIMGAPSEGFVMRSQKALFRQYMLTLMHKRATELGVLIPSASPDAIDLIRRLLDYEPSRRPSASLCLTHRFIIGMSNSLSPPVCSPLHIAPDEFDFELRKPNIDDLRSEINFEIAYYNQDSVQIQTIAENVSILVPKPKPKPKPRPVAIPTTNSYYDPYQQQYGTSSTGNYFHDNNARSVMKPAGEDYSDNATPEELHVVERVEMDIPGDTSTHKGMQREEQEGEEMDVCTDYVDAPAYPAQYTYTTNEAPVRNTNNTTSLPTYTYPATHYEPTRPTNVHKYSPNPNIIPTSASNNIPVLPVAPQHPVHPAQFHTPTATAVNTRYSPVNHRRLAEPAQQPTKITRPPTPLVQRWREDSISKTAARNNAQALYDTCGGDVNNDEGEHDQEESSLLYPSSNAATTTARAGTGTTTAGGGTNNVYPNYINPTHPAPATKYTNTTTTAPTIHKPPAPVPDAHAFSDSEPDAEGDGDTSSEIHAILSEGAEQRLGIPLYVSSTDSGGVDEKGGIEEDKRVYEQGTVSGEKGEYKEAYDGDDYADARTGRDVGSSRRDTPVPSTAATNGSHRYSASLPHPSTHTSGKALTSNTESMPIAIDTQASRGATGSGSGGGTTRTRSSSHISANVGTNAGTASDTAHQHERAERQKQEEEAAVVSSYFTCFCEHDREQEQEHERDSTTSPPRRRYRRQASSTEEESKIPDDQQQHQLPVHHQRSELQEHLLPQGDMEEGLSSQDYDTESGNYPTHRGVRTGSRGRARSDPEGRRKMWDSCVIA